ncbi:MAG: archease [Gammaproteobacteria bacterium]
MPDKKTGCRWEHFAHSADQGVRGFGQTVEEAFEQAAVALTALVCAPEDVQCRDCSAIECASEDDPALLLADWLNAVIYQMAVDNRLYGRFQVRIDANGLHALAWGESVDRSRHQPAVEPKGATYTELKVECDADGLWVAQCVIDV